MGKVTYLTGITASIALLLLVGLGACAETPAPVPVPSDTPVPPPATSSTLPATPAPTAVPPPPPAHSILEGTLAALERVDAWHVEMGMDVTAHFRSLSLEIPAAYAGDFRAPDRVAGTASAQFLGMTWKKDVVLVARTVAATAPGTGATTGTIFSLLDFAGLGPANIKDLEFVGEESLDGTPVYHLKGRVAVQEMEVAPRGVKFVLQGQAQIEVWIGVVDSLPRRSVVEGELVVSGPAQGTVHVAGTATFSDFGQPVAVESVSQPAVAVGMPCAVAGSGFVAHSDEARAISFCYPPGWVVDDLVNGCGFFAVSQTGVWPGKQIPESLVLIYPHQTVTRFSRFPAGTAEVCGQNTLCFLKWLGDSVLTGEAKTVRDRAQEAIAWGGRLLLGKEPLVGIVTGIQYAEEKAVVAGFLMDEGAYRPTVEAITYSIVLGRSAQR